MILDLGIKPYYSTSRGDLYNADCLDVLPLIPDKAVDLVLTDPPYGIGRDKGNVGFVGFGGFGEPIKRREYTDEWDTNRPPKEVFNALLKYTCLIFGGNYFTDLLPMGGHWVVWDKRNTMPTFSDCELVWTNLPRNSVKKYEFMVNGCMTQDKDDRVHPTQKPVQLFKRILIDYSKENNLILDPFSGSGTTAVACEDLNRRWICIEKEEKYCDLSAKRIEQFLSQGKLF